MQPGNILLDSLPHTIEIDGAEYEIDTDFRTAIRFSCLIQDRTIDDCMKIEIALYMFLGDVEIPDVREAISEILAFYRCGKPEPAEMPDKAESSARTYDFEYDADLIYAAFLEQYGIDLQTTESMHWWKFRALFASLSDKTEFMKIVGYRAIRITGDMSKEQKKRYTKLKKLYALPDNRTEEEKERDFAEALLTL